MGLPRSLLLIAALCACSPSLDWRRVTPPDLGVEILFPCRPSSLTREVALQHGRMPMVMHACSAAGSTFALSSLQLPTSAASRRRSTRCATLRCATCKARPSNAQSYDVPGMTPNPHAGRFVLNGRRPDDSAVHQHLLLFAHGARVYQASVLGDAPDDAAVSIFFSGVKVLQ
jgi:hypothetical protein